MKLQRLHIKNFKSIVDLEIVEPNPFTVFVGPNGSGKSNIFEALEFWSLNHKFKNRAEIVSWFGGKNEYNNFNLSFEETIINIKTLQLELSSIDYHENTEDWNLMSSIIEKPIYENIYKDPHVSLHQEYRKFVENYSRIFIKSISLEKYINKGSEKLNLPASNLEKVLKRIFLDETKRADILEWVQLLVPEFENIEIISDDFNGEFKLKIFEKHTKRHFSKSLISDGTYNILALLTAVYQSNEPQFLCIEEPENGLTPYVIEQFVELFRNACQEKGHYIWLNTHSPTLVRHLRADELIVVDKKQGATQIKQFKGKDYFGLRMDEAWLTNALGGGLPW